MVTVKGVFYAFGSRYIDSEDSHIEMKKFYHLDMESNLWFGEKLEVYNPSEIMASLSVVASQNKIYMIGRVRLF